jgi:histidinol-phosphate aminotransferase
MASFPLARPYIAEMEGYEPIDPPEVVARELGIAPDMLAKLDGNENPYGPSPKAMAALIGLSTAHLYPDPWQRELRRALAHGLGVDEGHIVCGAGSDDLLDVICRLWVGPGRRVVVAPPTFGMYGFLARLYGGEVVEVARRPDFSLDVEAMARALRGAEAVCFLASPNNPTGNLVQREELEALLATGALVVVDEAYVEFAEQEWPGRRHTFYPLAVERENLVVLRTFSKWAGLAGLRIGYGIMAKEMAALVLKAKMPYNVNVAAQVAALASLEDLGVLQERITAIVAERERMAQGLSSIPWLEVYPSQANFLLCRVMGRDAREVWQELRRTGVLVRCYAHPSLRHHLRISAGRPMDTERLLAAVQRLS